MRLPRRALLAAALLAASLPAKAALPRFPNSHAGQVVFVADGNLWAVPAAGGTAIRLTSDSGQDVFPRYAPNGKWIAFTANYQGNEDVYVIPAAGGPARRLTYQSDLYPGTGGRHGPNNMVVTWTPDSKNIVFLSRRKAWNTWIQLLFQVPVTGGLPSELPLDSGGLLTYGPDGTSIAYNRIFRNFRTWKRYTGGLAQQIYTYDFTTKSLTQITDWKGTNTSPMWYGHKIYYLSDQGTDFRANIWVYDLDTKHSRQITHFTDYDIDFPSLGDAELTFQQGGKLFAIDLPGERLHEIPLTVPDDGTRTQPRMIDAKPYIRATDMAQQPDYALSPNGKRSLLSARGDIFSIPTEDGTIRDLTGTPGIDEDHPTWSPDGTQIAYTTDATGSTEMALRPAAGGAEKILTHFGTGYLYAPIFSPDGKLLAYSDSAHRLFISGTDGSVPRQIAQDRFGEIHDQYFSPDGRYLAYSLHRDGQERSLFLYDIAAKHAIDISTEPDDDFAPVFSPDGKYLYFLSNRHENPVPSDTEFAFITLKSTGIYAIPLADTTPSPFAPKSDEGAVETKKKDNAAAWKPGAIPPIHIDSDGLMARAVAVPVPAGNIVSLDMRGSNLFYGTQPLQMLEGTLPGEKSALHIFDLEKRKDEVVTRGFDGYSLSADGTKILVQEKTDYAVLDAKADAGKDDDKKPLKLDDLRVKVDPKAEWSELFDNAWRLERDFFYSTAMNGVDWPTIRDSYRKLLPLAGTREDVNYLIGQVIGELANSHTYVGGGDDDDPTKPVPTAELGVDFGLDAASGHYIFAKIYQGDNTRPEYRSPLAEPGLGVHQGDALLAVNGTQLHAPADPYSLFVGITPDETITLTVSGPAGKPHDIVVKPIANDLPLREKAWIDANRATVDRLSGGRIAYIYMSNMEQLGMQQFIRQFYSQLGKQAVIVDDRWNGGGFIDQLVLERLRHILVGLDTNRERSAQSIPAQVITGPKICLINHYSASDGDIFPYFFRKYGLGKLLGTRTWGGVRGIRGNTAMMDNGYVTIPEFANYGLDSTWVIENHGVEPDITLENQPADLLAGHDRQLETAVSLLLQQIGNAPSGLPLPPALLPAYPQDGMVPPPSK